MSSMWVYPHSLSYFNESIGGPRNGPKYLIGSCVDWGQDLQYLKKLTTGENGHSQHSTFYGAYFGYLDPADLGVPLHLVATPEVSEVPLTMPPGSYAISVNFLYGYPWFVLNRTEANRQYDLNSLSRLSELVPVGHAGYSIRLFTSR